ncbi:MAG: AsmA-like C-terminal region-containing protein [Isosphaeraceae bacterium]
MMRIRPKLWRWLGLGLASVVVLVATLGTWIVPKIIVKQLEARYQGRITIEGWWINTTSAGVTGLNLFETKAGDSAVWASAQRVVTDLSLGSLIRGRLSPRTITLQSPRIVFRIGRDGKPLTRPELKGGDSTDPVPAVVLHDGQITIRQVNRPEAVISEVEARLATRNGAEVLSGSTDDPTWGPWTVKARFTDAFQQGSIELTSPKVAADPKKVRRIPFVPEEVWDHVEPDGLVGVHLAIDWMPKQAVQIRTVVTYKGTTLALPTLGLIAKQTNGRMTIKDGLIKLVGVEGRALDGMVKADGSLDFTRQPPRIDLNLNLDGLEIANAPKRWQLDKAALTGQLTGKVHLLANLGDDGADLTGTSGEAVIKGGTVGGIPVKSLRLVMSAEGSELRYDTPTTKAGLLGGLLMPLIALQQAPVARTTVEPSPHKGLVLPRSISTEIELEDVDLAQVVAKVEVFGIHLPFVVAGRLSLKAKATIPLGTLRDVKTYAFHGEATLQGASIAGVHLGHVVARLDLADGVLDLRDFRGLLVALQDEGIRVQTPETDPVPAAGPLPVGGFRTTLHAEIAPPGRLIVQFEGNQLPIGELTAPVLPGPTPLAGLLTTRVKAEADVARIVEPHAWTASGSLQSAQITYRGSTLDAVSTTFNLDDGRLDLPDLAAQLGKQLLKAQARLGLTSPYPFSGALDVAGWDLADVLAFVPSTPRPAPIKGILTAKADADGTLSPWSITSQGEGRINTFQAGPVPLGDLPFQWTTADDLLTVSVLDARPFGGRLTAKGTIPAKGSGPIQGAVTIKDLDTGKLSAAIPGDQLKLNGRADGQIQFTIPADAVNAAIPLQATLTLSAPGLTVQGLPTRGLQANIEVRDGALTYNLSAESLGGKIKVQGEVPLSAGPTTDAKARVQVAGFRLADAFQSFGVTGALGSLRGLGAVTANLLWKTSPLSDIRLRAVAEVRELRWGKDYPLGRLRGEVSFSPKGWRIDPLTGLLWNGQAHGTFWGKTPAQEVPTYGFDLAVNRAALGRVAAFVPTLSRQLDGDADLTLNGTFDEVLRAKARVEVSRGTLFRLPVSNLRAPAALTYTPASSRGALVVQDWSTRLAGGRVRGDARFQIGLDRAFQADLRLDALDLETIVRALADVRRPASGKINGRIKLYGTNPDDLRTLRGRAVLDLDDASVVELPIFREIDRFLGASRGGLFEDGDVIATIAHGQIMIDPLTLEGRTVQLHMTGTVNFDNRLDLEVLVNTRELIPQTGQALIGLIPGLNNVIGRREQAILQVGNFLSNRLLKFRVTGTLSNPSVNIDPAVAVSNAAVGFFGGALKLPIGLLR